MSSALFNIINFYTYDNFCVTRIKYNGFFVGVRVVHLLSLLCYPIICFYVLNSVL